MTYIVLFFAYMDSSSNPEPYRGQIIVSTERNANSLVQKTRAKTYECNQQISQKMLKEQQSAVLFEDDSQWPASETLDVRAIIQECRELPPDVTRAELTRVEERIIDQRLLSILVSQSLSESDDPEWVVRHKRRKEALLPYLGRILFCVFIRLPGIHYTIEVDPELQRVVHWEWQDELNNRRTNS